MAGVRTWAHTIASPWLYHRAMPLPLVFTEYVYTKRIRCEIIRDARGASLIITSSLTPMGQHSFVDLITISCMS